MLKCTISFISSAFCFHYIIDLALMVRDNRMFLAKDERNTSSKAGYWSIVTKPTLSLLDTVN